MRGTLRDIIVSNLMDGDDSGMITMRADTLADELTDIVAQAVIHSLGLEDWGERYFQP